MNNSGTANRFLNDLSMRASTALLLSLSAPAFANQPTVSESTQTWSPLRVNIECQGYGRTKACPSFLRGFVDESPALEWGTRASAQVILYFNNTTVANDDLMHLRLTSSIVNAPSELEITQSVDTRGTDDEQRAQLQPAFERGVAVFLGALVPEAVQIEFVAPETQERVEPKTTPWGFSAWVGGWGNWTENFQSRNTWTGLSVSRLTDKSNLSWSLSGDNSSSRQPPLVIDGTEISLDSSSYGVYSTFLGERHLSDSVSLGALVRGGHQDSEGRYWATGRAHVGTAYDWFAADDPRGNVLAVAYLIGVQKDRYNLINVLNEEEALFPTHGVLMTGSVRVDKVTYGVRGQAMAMLLDPATRYVLNFAPQLGLQVGSHVDFNIDVGVTKQATPGPRDLDLGDFESVTRSSYADPLQLDSYLNLRFHWDRTNGARNNRWSVADRLGSLSTL